MKEENRNRGAGFIPPGGVMGKAEGGRMKVGQVPQEPDKPQHVTFPESWSLLAVSEVVRNVSLTDKKIPQKNYLPSGKFPVLDQGQDFVGGYTNDAEMLVDCVLPVIVFGDHTRVVKLINTRFAPGADGVKVLQPTACILPRLLGHFVCYLEPLAKGRLRGGFFAFWGEIGGGGRPFLA